MLRLPKVGPSAGRGGASLAPLPQQKKAASADIPAPHLSSPQVRALPATYFTQVYSQTAVVASLPRGSCLYATPHGPEVRTMRSASTGKLPVMCLIPFCFPSQFSFHQPVPCSDQGCSFSICFTVLDFVWSLVVGGAHSREQLPNRTDCLGGKWIREV